MRSNRVLKLEHKHSSGIDSDTPLPTKIKVTSETDAVKARITETIKESDINAKDFTFELASKDILGNLIYYVEWNSPDRGKEETLCYALVNKSGEIRTFDDGITAVQYIHDQLERRRSFVQRLNEFSLFEFVAATIALSVTAAVIYQVLTKQLTQEFVGIFGIILGYYFGKTISDKR